MLGILQMLCAQQHAVNFNYKCQLKWFPTTRCHACANSASIPHGVSLQSYAKAFKSAITTPQLAPLGRAPIKQQLLLLASLFLVASYITRPRSPFPINCDIIQAQSVSASPPLIDSMLRRVTAEVD